MQKTKLALIAAGILACGLTLHDAPARAVAATNLTQPRVITKLVGRRQTITVTATGKGPRYSVATLDGEVLLSSVTIEQLREKDPFSYRQINTSVAADTAPMTWAGVEAVDR